MRALPAVALGLICTASSADLSASAAGKPETFCIKRREINAISALDDRHAFAKLSASRFYLLTLDKTCRGLKAARTLGLDASSSRVCADGATLVTFQEPGMAMVRCRVEAIDEVADKNAALDLIEARAEPK